MFHYIGMAVVFYFVGKWILRIAFASAVREELIEYARLMEADDRQQTENKSSYDVKESGNRLWNKFLSCPNMSISELEHTLSELKTLNPDILDEDDKRMLLARRAQVERAVRNRRSSASA